jgi:hypothetical protein
MKNLSLFHEELRALLGHHEDSLEYRWMSSFKPKEFAAVGLSGYFPRIYRGLPRCFQRQDPTISRIKREFTDLSLLRKLSVDRAIFSLYAGQLVSRPWKIGILTWVIADGLGDWIAAQETARLIQEKWPDAKVHLFPISRKNLPKHPEFPTELIQYTGEETNALLSPLLKNMDFVLQIPTYFPPLQESYASVGEYGYLESSWFHPATGRSSMGLHVLEKGIFIRKQKRTSFAEIEQKKLLLYLFGTEMPGPIEMEAYAKRARFHVAYLATPIGGAIYLHALLKMFEHDPHHLDVCSPDPNWIVNWIEMREKEGLPVLEESFGVKELILQGPEKEYRWLISPSGQKTLRILCPGIFTQEDMRHLIALSGEWVGVRGNQSFSEAISAGKTFFYDGRSHAKFWVKDLAAMAENRLSDYKNSIHAFRLMVQAYLWNLEAEEDEWVDEMEIQREGRLPWFEIATELGALLQDGDTIAGYKKYCRLIAEEKSVAPFLRHLVERGLIHKLRPELKHYEEGLMQQFGEGVIPFSILVKKLKMAMI